MRMTKKTRIIVASTLTLLILATVAMTSSFGGKEQAVRRLPVNLNETLTNEVSDTATLRGFDRQVKDYMTAWGLKGVSLSIMRNDSLLYSKGYGWADDKEPMEPGHIMRMASVSKLITAVGIMILQERGMLTLKDQVFGPGGILDDSLYNAAIADSLYKKITVEDLLRHKGGFSKKGGDPMFSTRWIMMQNQWKEVPTKEQLTTVQLGRPLKFEPGTWQEYSNYGYLALSMVIEKLSGMSYEDFIQENVFHPAGCVNFKIAGNYYADKHPGETRYYVQKDDEPVEEFNNSGRKVARSYGGNNVTGLLGAGAWVGSTPELTLLVASIDGKPEVPDIISEASVKAMTEYFDPDTFSLGWNDTKPTGEWTRTGTFAGTSALVKYFPDGECWVFISNTSTYKGPGLAKFTTELFEKLRASYSDKFPLRNLFYAD
jgi:CubicO group peptidase (beta-lactamase class C family)